MNIHNIENIDIKCTGCGACAQTCPVKCIEMTWNIEGFLYPNITKDCINCEKCVKICHVNNPIKLNKVNRVYTVRTKDIELLMDSTSGGAFTEIARFILDNGGFVFGAEFDDDFTGVHHSCTNKISDLIKYRGSKYIQSNIKDCFCEVKNLLENNKPVLFSGTPCQIAGLKCFLGKDYSNLYTMDFICHGVGSTRVFKDFLNDIVRGGEITDIKFRSKIKKYNNGNGGVFSVNCVEGIIYSKPLFSSPFGYAFSRSMINRISCSECVYSRPQRVSDITVSDFMSSEDCFERVNGASIFFVNTPKGQQVFDYIKRNLVYKKRNLNDSDFYKKIPNRFKHFEKPNEMRKQVFNYYDKYGYKKTKNKYFRDTLMVSSRKYLINILSKFKKRFLNP